MQVKTTQKKAGEVERRKQMNIRVEPALYQALEALARQERRSVPQAALQLLEEGLRHRTGSRAMADDALVVTNHYQSADMAPLQVGFLKLPGSVLDEHFLTVEGSQQRATEMVTRLRPGMTTAEAQRLVTEPCLVSGGQVQSVVMDLGAGELWLAEGTTLPVCATGYRRVTLCDLGLA